MGHALRRLAGVTVLGGQVRVNAMQQQLETLGGIAQTAERKASAGQRSGGERTTQWLGAESRLGAGLQLLEEFLRKDEREQDDGC